MSEQTQYKYLPNVPTPEMKLAMANAFIASLKVAQEENHDLTNPDTCSTILSFVFEQGWQAAPEFKRMPFSGGDVRKIYESVKAETGLNLSLGTFFVAFDAAERAHGIGV
jgi:hypothetical protein